MTAKTMQRAMVVVATARMDERTPMGRVAFPELPSTHPPLVVRSASYSNGSGVSLPALARLSSALESSSQRWAMILQQMQSPPSRSS